jgi:hypothetical protein
MARNNLTITWREIVWAGFLLALVITVLRISPSRPPFYHHVSATTPVNIKNFSKERKIVVFVECDQKN